ncbi:MAG TPA: FtsX-like permease family protein [Acidobacteriaceae bacterium]
MKRLTQRIDGALDALRAVPGVEAAATSDWLPGMPGQSQIELIRAEGEQDESHKILAITRLVSSGYFHTLGIPVLQGRDCAEDGGPPSVLVNHSFASRYLQQVTPIGSHLRTAAQNVLMPIAVIRGIVGDAREGGLNTAPSPTVYPCVSAPSPSPWFLVRTHGDPMALVDTIRMKLHRIEPARSVFNLSPLEDHISDSLTENRLRTMVLTFFAGTAISLACLGLYGTLSYLGRMRRREMGLRLAIGAMRRQIVAVLLVQGLRIVSIGCIAGLAMGRAAGHLIQGMLYAITPTDPETYAAIVLLVVVVATGACLGPALRAATTDPAKVLREE